MSAPAILVSAHGKGAEAGDVLVAQTPPLAELGPPSAERTEAAIVVRKARGRPYTRGNRAGADRGPSLVRVSRNDSDEAPCDPAAPMEKRKARRRAASLHRWRKVELEQVAGGRLSSAALVEIVAWARATAWADLFDRAGDPVKAQAFAGQASTHGLRALGLAEREGAARAAASPPVVVDYAAQFAARAAARRAAAGGNDSTSMTAPSSGAATEPKGTACPPSSTPTTRT